MKEKKITEKDIKENMEEMENALKRGGKEDLKTAAEAAKFLLINANLLSSKESVEVSGLIRKMLEKAKNKGKK